MTIRVKLFAPATLLPLLFGQAFGVSPWLQHDIDAETGNIEVFRVPITAAVTNTDLTPFEYELVVGLLLRTPAMGEPGRDMDRIKVAAIGQAAERERALV